jgi:hypothetical protein
LIDITAARHCTRGGADCFFPTNNPPFPLTKCARASSASIDPRLISKSTEEKSSNRREQTRGNPENRQRNSTRRSGNWRHWDGTEKAHTTGAMTEGTGSAAARLAAPYQPENASRCDLEPIRIFEHRIERVSTRKGVRPFAFLPENHRLRNIHRLRSLAALALVCFSCASTAVAQQTNTPVQIRDTGISGCGCWRTTEGSERAYGIDLPRKGRF